MELPFLVYTIFDLQVDELRAVWATAFVSESIINMAHKYLLVMELLSVLRVHAFFEFSVSEADATENTWLLRIDPDVGEHGFPWSRESDRSFHCGLMAIILS